VDMVWCRLDADAFANRFPKGAVVETRPHPTDMNSIR